jgi:pimeloyl-ACP methyl ester carboxylesterase
MIETVTIRHGRIDLALHRLRDATPDVAGTATHPLLLLHGLGERTPDRAPQWLERWPGEIWGFDFTGHGASTVPVGGGYTAEILAADADMVLEHLGAATVLGRGLGAWVALLLAGARPALVRGVILDDGPGLIGGGIQPGSPFVSDVPDSAVTGAAPDPFALIELARDVRPPDYAAVFVRFILEGSELAEPIVVSAVSRPEWLAAVAAEPGVVEMPAGEALSRMIEGAATSRR